MTTITKVEKYKYNNKELSLSGLTQDQIKALIKVVHTVSSESVILVKNRVNNL